VFLGDLTDRGPDSPGVVDLVRDLVQAGRAQCVLGNHDLNIILGQQKHDNGWFFGREFFDEDGTPIQQVLADESIRRSATKFFRMLPLVLERGDVRIVHACWHPEMIDFARTATDAVPLRFRLLEQRAIRAYPLPLVADLDGDGAQDHGRDVWNCPSTAKGREW
jgi:hypothetical protein